MKTLFQNIILSAFLFTLLSVSIKSEDNNNRRLGKTGNQASYSKLNINNISTTIWNDGLNDQNEYGNSGFEYPKGSGNYAVYASGFAWAGSVKNELRGNGSIFQSGLTPGKIGPGGVPGDASSARIYRVRSDYKTASLIEEINDREGTAEQIREQYESDWNQWPADQGAPYEDINKDGKYSPQIDIPGVPGAGQTIWYVVNDLNADKTLAFSGTMPIGIEMQFTAWAYKEPGPVKNMIFRKYKLINKGGEQVDSMHIMIWGDPDLGDAVDDYVGCDTLLNLEYVYNSRTKDNIYGYTPPSVGFTLLQGPRVNASALDTALYDGKKIPGMKNLPITSFVYVFNNTYLSDLMLNRNFRQLYYYMQGLDNFGKPLHLPASLGGGVTKFLFSGDPVTGTGYIEGMPVGMQTVTPPGDRRFGMGSGPFTFAPGDTQEVVTAEIAAGATKDIGNLQAINVLKNYTGLAHQFFEQDMPGARLPKSPAVKAAGYKNEIVLNWGSNENNIDSVESNSILNYRFQGYKVYQLPKEDSKITEAKRIAVFDKIDGIKEIVEEENDPETGAIIHLVRQFGTDSGIKRNISIKKDAFTEYPLINGRTYYFAVTSYYFNPDMNPKSMESQPLTISVMPQENDPGVFLGKNYGDTLKVKHTSGRGDGVISPIVVDPNSLNGHDYRLDFKVKNGVVYGRITDITLNRVVLDSIGISEDGELRQADGIETGIFNPPSGMKSDGANNTDDRSKWGWDIPSGARRFTWNGAQGLRLEGFEGAMGAGITWLGSSVGYDKLKNILIKFAETDTSGVANPNDPNISYAYRYLRGANSSPAKPEFANYIVRKVSGYSYQDFKKNFPFAAYDVEDPIHPRRLSVGYLENNAVNGLLDGKYWPPITGTDNTSPTSPREWFFVFDTDYAESPDQNLQGDLLSGQMPILIHATANRNSKSFSNGDQFAIFVNHQLSSEDAYTFSSPATEYNKDRAAADVEKINVFPNPYYCLNAEKINGNNNFVTFSHLPQKATIRIFNLAGQLVKTIHKDTPSQFMRWDLLNDHNFQIASGLYLVHVEMPGLGKSKILKMAIIQQQFVPERY